MVTLRPGMQRPTTVSELAAYLDAKAKSFDPSQQNTNVVTNREQDRVTYVLTRPKESPRYFDFMRVTRNDRGQVEYVESGSVSNGGDQGAARHYCRETVVPPSSVPFRHKLMYAGQHPSTLLHPGTLRQPWAHREEFFVAAPDGKEHRHFHLVVRDSYAPGRPDSEALQRFAAPQPQASAHWMIFGTEPPAAT